MNPRRVLGGIVALAPIGYLLAGGQPEQKTVYSADVAPILKAHCGSCHSGAEAAAGLDLLSVSGLLKGGASGKAIVPGNPDASLLLVRILGKNGKPRMPMGFPALTDDDTNKIRAWIHQGAKIDPAGNSKHWSYVKPVPPALPQVQNAAWVRNPVDDFVLSRLEKEGLKPSPEASKETLIRRVSLDLTGLPPSPADIDAFLADKRPDAYERLVDKLLASPHFGERQAQPWLDLSRYADTDGYEKDLNRVAWKYRDWVIAAFNHNMPYDQFTIQQLAGDLLPFKSYDQLIATGFNRNTMMNLEGGVDQAEAHFNVVIDRVDTTATVWLGSTLQCARCHDHKFDPFTQKDFYKMSAFFGNARIIPEGPASVGEEKWFESSIPVPTGKQVAEETKLSLKIHDLEAQITAAEPQVIAGFAQWRNAIVAPVVWSSLPTSAAESNGKSNLTVQSDGSVLVSGPNPDKDTYTVKASSEPLVATALRIEALPDKTLTANGPGRADNGNFVLTRASLKINGKAVPFESATADFTQSGYDLIRVIQGDPDSGWAVNGQIGKPHTLVLGLTHPESIQKGDAIEVVLEQQSGYTQHAIGRFRLSLTGSASPEAAVLPVDILALARKSSLNAADQIKLSNYYRSVAPVLHPLRAALAKANQQLETLQSEVPSALIMEDKPIKGPLTAYVHSRGEFLSKTEQVTAGTPAFLPKMSAAMPGNRLGLAEWIASKDNPLTARVEVNRLWEQYFGRGIVETSEDFGTQGSKPTHPELLDWLATEFMRRNWDIKAMCRIIVTSSTYRQSSSATPELIARDPTNNLLARGPRFRLSAEVIRDEELKAAGLLSLKVGGPSVYPAQPPGIWDSPYSGQAWMTSMSADRYRRGLYTFWKRTAPYPSFMSFDATSREECTVRRIRTNTPLQALALLNDQATFEAAKALGKLMEKKSPSAPSGIVFGFRSCTGRRPTQRELERLEALLTKLKSRYQADRAAATKVAGSPTDAAYTMTANVLLNLDETITKG